MATKRAAGVKDYWARAKEPARHSWWNWEPSNAEVEAGYRDILSAFEGCGMIERKPKFAATKNSVVGG